MTLNRDDVGSRLAHTLGLSQSPGKDVMKKFATRTRALRQQQGRTLDQAAMMAAKEIFPAEFQPTRYAGSNHAVRLWDVQSGKEAIKAIQHDSPVWVVDFDGDGKTLATGSEDSTVQLWPEPIRIPRNQFQAWMREKQS
jgi:hypothetical protein